MLLEYFMQLRLNIFDIFEIIFIFMFYEGKIQVYLTIMFIVSMFDMFSLSNEEWFLTVKYPLLTNLSMLQSRWSENIEIYLGNKW